MEWVAVIQKNLMKITSYTCFFLKRHNMPIFVAHKKYFISHVRTCFTVCSRSEQQIIVGNIMQIQNKSVQTILGAIISLPSNSSTDCTDLTLDIKWQFFCNY